RIAQRDLPGLDLQHHAGRRELLAERSRLEDGVVGDRYVVLDVGEAVALGLDHGAVLHDTDRNAGDLLTGHLSADEIVDTSVLLWSSGVEDSPDRESADGHAAHYAAVWAFWCDLPCHTPVVGWMCGGREGPMDGGNEVPALNFTWLSDEALLA